MQTLSPRISKRTVWIILALAALFLVLLFFWSRPVAEVEVVRRGTAISAVYGTVQIEPSFVNHVRAQNAGFIQLAEPVSAGRGAIGKQVRKGELLATITDESTARLLKQAQADLQAATESARLELPSSEPLKIAEGNVQRLEKLVGLSNVPAVEYEKAKSEANRLRDALKNERIERDRNLEALRAAAQKAEAQMKNTEIRAPMDGILSGLRVIDGELIADGNELLTVSSRKNYVRGEVNEEDVGEVKAGMKAELQMYAYRTRQFNATVSSILPAADPETQRYTIVLELENPPENLMAGMTGEMNIITGRHENALLIPTRALLVDQVLAVAHTMVEARTVRVGYRTLEFAEALSGVKEGARVVVADQDQLRPGQFVRQRLVHSAPAAPRR
ncbi:MAG: efflux RND transporter periplasmic adaptor subunit [Chthoniobacterales bacterium]|nr:efflux RND transporter periplasmic adaptor subunit [Chthoniobacterales bacterium]